MTTHQARVPAGSGWHATPDELAAYAGGRTGHAVTASVEAHLMHCAQCRAGLSPLVDPAPLALVWDQVRDDLEVPARPLVERWAARLGLSDRDALLAGAAPAAQGAMLLAVVICVSFAVLAAGQDAPRTPLLFLLAAPLIPVAAVAVAYGQDADPLWETTLAAPYAPVRLILLRVLTVVGVAVPAAVVAALLSPVPAWMAAAWLLPALAAAATTLALSTWVPVQVAAAGVAGAWVVPTLAVAKGVGNAALLLAVPMLLAYALVAVVAAAVFWLRLERLSFLGRMS